MIYAFCNDNNNSSSPEDLGGNKVFGLPRYYFVLNFPARASLQLQFLREVCPWSAQQQGKFLQGHQVWEGCGESFSDLSLPSEKPCWAAGPRRGLPSQTSHHGRAQGLTSLGPVESPDSKFRFSWLCKYWRLHYLSGFPLALRYGCGNSLLP